MLVFHLIVERKNLSSPILPISHPTFLGNIEGEIYHFLSSPLHDSSDNEDASFHHLELSDCDYHDILIHSIEHDSEFSTVDLSKPSIFDDPSSDELETQAIKEL